MSTQFRSDLPDFFRFVGEKVNNGGATLSPEEVLDEWRRLHPDPATSEDEIAAIQEAIDDMDNGDAGIPFEEFDREFRARRNIPSQP